MAIDLQRLADLNDLAGVENGDTIAHGQRLALVMVTKRIVLPMV
jgi:hypothetical protein